MWDLQTIQLLILRVLQERNTDILAGNWNPELNLWGWADVQEQQLPHFTKQIKLGGENCRRKKEKHHLAWALKPCYFSSQRLRLQVELTVPYPLFLWFVRTCHDFPLQPCHFRPVTFYLLGASQSSSVSRLSGSFHEQRPSPFTAQILYQRGIDLLFCSVTVWYTP